MRLSEIIIIYLATAAPFGVAHFQRRPAGASSRTRAILAAAWMACVWPVTAASVLFGWNSERGDEALEDEGDAGDAVRIERAKRAVFDSLVCVEELFEAVCAGKDVESRQTFFAARESIERYAGLTLAEKGAELNAPPTPRELELCRVSGRTGQDLIIAGRCLHRRNVIRLRLQRERARTELLHALAEVRERACSQAPLGIASQVESARRLSEAILNSYCDAINLLSLLDDSRAVESVARLLDAECARLRKLEIEHARDEQHAPFGGESCTISKAIKSSAMHGLTSRTHI